MFPPFVRLALALCAPLFVVASARAVVYPEVGDAGQLRATAQTTGPANQPLTAITGTLASAVDIDLFLINITDPLNFSATTVNATTGFFDTALFLFDTNGRPVYANDDDPGGMTIASTLPAGNALGPQIAGLYYLGISFSRAEPVTLSNIRLFATGAATTSIRGPNTTTSGSLTNWDTSSVDGSGFSFPSAYRIDLTGATTAAVPEPTTLALALVGLAGVITWSRSSKTVNPQTSRPQRHPVQPQQI